ncbi:hypothetical protein ABT392_07840 [Paucibacter sp. JuS9]|uniref:hypothetical protein n=1 Tax=Paucibacter sp. JuS9 TaxID=3228748 RepID=UPI003757FD67
MLDPRIEGDGTWRTALAMLLLTYPEIDWRFARRPSVFSPLPPAFEPEPAPSDIRWAFDPKGRRDFVRQIMCREGFAVVTRELQAVAIDDESDFACFHAYVAYRCGYRTDIVTSWALMKQRLDRDDCRPDLLLEDVSLKFADRPVVSIARLKDRAQHFRGLAYPLPCPPTIGPRRVQRLRWLVTSGHNEHDAELESDAHDMREQERAHGGDGGVFWKPVAGMYDLRRQAWLRLFGFAAAHHLPTSRGHGAPGKVALVAQTLVVRARDLRNARPGLEGLLLAAVCALDALELSGGESPTLGFEALSLRHECEVLAECSFGGLQHRIEVQERFIDISDALQTLAAKVHESSRTGTQLNAEISILTALMRLFREHARFDEELACLNRIRDVKSQQIRLTFEKTDPTTWLTLLRWFTYEYFKLLIRTPQHFVAAILVWLGMLAMAFHFTGYDGVTIEGSPVGCALLDALSSFIGMGAPAHPKSCEYGPGPGTGYFTVVSIAIALGAVHLGIFVSYVYTLLARR